MQSLAYPTKVTMTTAMGRHQTFYGKYPKFFVIISFLYRSAYRHVTKFLKLIKYLLLLEPVTQRGANIFFSLFLILIFFHCFAFLSLHFNKIV